MEEDDSRAISPVTPTSDEEYTYRSPVMSDRSSSGSNGSKKRRSYDKSYKTHEPLKGLPEVEFEEKPWDVDAPSPTVTEYEPENKPTYAVPEQQQDNDYSVPFDQSNKRHTYMEPEAAESQTDGQVSKSNPDLLDNNNRLTYNPYDYAVVDKKKDRRDRVQSQSSIITDV